MFLNPALPDISSPKAVERSELLGVGELGRDLKALGLVREEWNYSQGLLQVSC